MDGVALEGEGRVEAAVDAVEYLFSDATAGKVGEQEDEFVAADAGEEVASAELELHAAADGLEVEVADAVAVAIVDLLEAIEVDVEKAEDLRLRYGAGFGGGC